MCSSAPASRKLGLVPLALILVELVDHAAAETYTTNAICKRNNCINPIFPGMEDLHRLEEASWQCSSLRTVSRSLKFCRGAITYDPALPVLDIVDQEALVRKQDTAALTMFHYHLAGLGMEGWDYPDPARADDCVKSIWKMTCYTYFPRAQMGCQEGYATGYIRPCKSGCQNYVRACHVECCDESVQCVFQHSKKLSPTLSVLQTGYVAHDGPSSLCTGAAGRRSPIGVLALLLPLAQALGWLASSGPLMSRQALVVASLLGMTVALQGCDLDVPTHSVGNWRAEPDYLITYEFVPPGGSARAAMLNSCSMDMLAPTAQCGGRGVCKLWDATDLDKAAAAFCQCDRDWADPECSTHRKSQLVAYLLAIFGGPFGADQFYLGFPIAGSLKLATLGGFGTWWVWDIIRTGSAPVLSKNFRVSADLPHWTFVLGTVSLALFIGFVISYATMIGHVSARRKAALRVQSEEEHRSASGGQEGAAAKLSGWPCGMPNYGSTGQDVAVTLPPARIRERL